MVGRPFAAALEPLLKQPVVVETKAGAAGAVGAQFAANAKPDGYTLIAHLPSISGFAEVDKLFGRTPKFTRADFIPIARLTEGPMVLVVNDQQPHKTLKEFVDDAKANPEQADLLVIRSLRRAASAGRAADQGRRHPAAPSADRRRRARADRGARQQRAGAGVLGRCRERADEGRQAARALLLLAEARRVAPDVPTLKELGYDVEFSIWVGLFAPEGHARCGDHAGARRDQEGGRDRSVQDGDRERRRCRRPHRSAGVQGVLGRGRASASKRPCNRSARWRGNPWIVANSSSAARLRPPPSCPREAARTGSFPVARRHHRQRVSARRRQRSRDAADRDRARGGLQAAGRGRHQGRRRRRGRRAGRGQRQARRLYAALAQQRPCRLRRGRRAIRPPAEDDPRRLHPAGAALRRSGAAAGERPAALQDAGRVHRRRQEDARADRLLVRRALRSEPPAGGAA